MGCGLNGHRKGLLAVLRSPEYGTIVVEHRTGCAALHDAALAELRRQLGYKCPWYGSRLHLAPAFYPSSKTCSRCGAVRADLPLWQRVFRCDVCGLELDRDENAARNLAALAAAVAGSGPETGNARGGDVRPGLSGQSPVKREAGGTA